MTKERSPEQIAWLLKYGFDCPPHLDGFRSKGWNVKGVQLRSHATEADEENAWHLLAQTSNPMLWLGYDRTEADGFICIEVFSL